MEKYQPGAIVLQCGADSLAGKGRPIPYRTLTYPTLPYPTLPYPPYPTLAYLTLHYPTLPSPTLPYTTLPYPRLPYLTLPYSALSHYILYPHYLESYTLLSPLTCAGSGGVGWSSRLSKSSMGVCLCGKIIVVLCLNGEEERNIKWKIIK